MASVVVTSTLAAYAMQFYIGIYVERDLPRVLGSLVFLHPVVAALEIAAALALWRRLGPLARAVRGLDEGRTVGAEERAAARAAAGKIDAVVVTVVAVGFVGGPAASMIANSLGGVWTYGAVEAAINVAVSLSIGFDVALLCIILVDSVLREPIARLAFHDRPAGGRRSSFRGRVVAAGAAALCLSGVLLAAAGWGALHAAARGAAPSASAFIAEAAGLLAAVAAAALPLFVVIGSSLAREAESIAARVAEAAAGSGDLSLRAAIVGADEMGRLGAAFNALLDTLQGMLGRVRELASSLAAGAGSLSASSESARGSVAGLDESLAAMRGAVERQSETVSSTEGEIAAMVESIEQVASRMTDQAGYVEQSSAAVSEMAANIASVSRTAAMADDLARKLAQASEEGGEALKASLSSISEIAASSESVRNIVGVIARIAAQTNLLAMNAAIEAAHAGAAGAGFAVVANEVRGLAEGAGKSAKEIEGLVRGMSERIARGAGLSDKAGAAFDRIREGVRETGELVQTIDASMSEQREGAQEILRSVGSLAESARLIEGLTADQRSKSKAMEEAMLRIIGASNEIFEAVQDETGAIQALGRVVAAVDGEAARNREGVRGLEEAVSRLGSSK